MEEELEKKENELKMSSTARVKLLQEKLDGLQKKENIRKAREDRVTMEPDLTEDSVVVCIKHISLGRIQRLFACTDRAQAVYDWIGSLCHEPLYFELCTQFSQDVINPDSEVKHLHKNLLIMIETTVPVNIGQDESVTFAGHHIDLDEVFEKIEHRRLQVRDSLSGIIKSICVSRDSVFEDLMGFYKQNDDILNHNIMVYFQDEQAAGDGVAREAYSIFIDSLLLRSCEGTVQFIPIMQPEFGESEFKTVGTVLYHFFINYGLFPIQLSRASMEHVLIGRTTNSCLLESFFAFISKSAGSTLCDALYHGKFVRDDIIDILTTFGIVTLPTKENISELVCKVAKNELITKPYPVLLAMRSGFDNFFEDVNSSSITALYDMASPTNLKVMKYIYYPQPVDKLEDKTFNYLRRYVQDANRSILQNFLQFVTGSSFILPGIQICVATKIMTVEEARPYAQTCVKLLTLPKNMPTYYAFQQKMDYFFTHSEHWVLED